MYKFKSVLVTGGAGFIGSHLVDRLVNKGIKVRVMDNLYRQIHPSGRLPDYFNSKAEFFKGDTTRRADWEEALNGIDAVCHLAAAVGVGQSMYEVEHYVKVNSLGTAILLDILANKKHSIKKILVAASMSSYGEGTYKCRDCGLVRPPLREEKKLLKRNFNVYCPNCHKIVEPVSTNEEAKQNSNSIYAIGKKEQEEMIIVFGKAYRIPVVAMRYFNVYGPRQSLSNPYNGVVAIFMSRIKNNHPPIINEDGLQSRDFVHVYDVAEANLKALFSPAADYQVFNVGAGKPMAIMDVANILISLYHSKLKPEITYKIRKLDVRHCYADIGKISKLLNWSPKITFGQGLKELIAWGRKEKAVDKVDFAMKELEKRGLR